MAASEVEADLVVGADGIRSVVRGLVFGSYTPVYTVRLPHFISDMHLLLTSGHRANPSTLNQEFYHGCSWISMSECRGGQCQQMTLQPFITMRYQPAAERPETLKEVNLGSKEEMLKEEGRQSDDGWQEVHPEVKAVVTHCFDQQGCQCATAGVCLYTAGTPTRQPTPLLPSP